MTALFDGEQAQPALPRPGSRKGHTPLGLGPLETAIMQTLWRADTWVTVQIICDNLDYSRPIAYTTAATIVGILSDKGLVLRELRDSAKRPGSQVWWYRAAQPQTEHIGNLIATLLDYSLSPAGALAHALATTTTTIHIDVTTTSATWVGMPKGDRSRLGAGPDDAVDQDAIE